MTLFGEIDAAPVPARATGPFAGVALEQSVDRLLDYSIPARLLSSLRVGQRVKVPLGRNNKASYGYVVSIKPQTEYPKIKNVSAIDDERVLVDAPMLELARWISRYYVTPLGAVIDNIIPAAVKKMVGIGYSQLVSLEKDRSAVQEMLEKTRAPKRRSVLARLLQLEPGSAIEINRLAGEAGVTTPTVRKLSRAGLISIRSEPDIAGLTNGTEIWPGAELEIAFNEDQQRVFDALAPRVRGGGFSVNLLFGVTGSGKTEVYLRCIKEVIQQGKQAIVLVPEIALTPQTVRRFTARFPRVAVLHSGLSATQRHRFWQQISIGQADVVVGARSAVFAPVPKLGIIVVDEEHESSYKQDTAPRYHARDVAIKRAQLLGVPVVLGSATPALETWRRASVPPVTKDGNNSAPPLPPGEGGGEGSLEARTGSAASACPHPNPLPEGEGIRSALPLPPVEGTGSAPPLPPGEGGGEGSFEGRTGTAAPARPHPNPLPEGEGIRSALPLPSGEGSRGAWHLLELPHRVRGLQLPTVELIDMKQEARLRKGVHLISRRLEHLLQHTLSEKHQAILLLNRRGYSNFVYCKSCENVMECKYCDATLTYHRTAGADAKGASIAQSLHKGQLHCHYCLAVNPLPAICPKCGKKLSLFGMGTQRVEEELLKRIPNVRYARVDSDTMRGTRDYEKVLGQFARKELDLLLGTQMIAKGLDFPNVTLVGVVSGDTALALPDFRASERTFQLITQVAGRAGRGDSPGRVVVQSFIVDQPAIQLAVKQDYPGFAASEMKDRKEVGLPPFSRIVRLVLRDQDQEKLNKLAGEVAGQLLDAAAVHGDHVIVRGPAPCAINRIANYHRVEIRMISPSPTRLQNILATVREKGALARSARIAVDVDPVSLL